MRFKYQHPIFIPLLLAIKQIPQFTVYVHTQYQNKDEHSISMTQASNTPCISFLPHYVISIGDLGITTAWYSAVNLCSK